MLTLSLYDCRCSTSLSILLPCAYPLPPPPLPPQDLHSDLPQPARPKQRAPSAHQAKTFASQVRIPASVAATLHDGHAALGMDAAGRSSAPPRVGPPSPSKGLHASLGGFDGLTSPSAEPTVKVPLSELVWDPKLPKAAPQGRKGPEAGTERVTVTTAHGVRPKTAGGVTDVSRKKRKGRQKPETKVLEAYGGRHSRLRAMQRQAQEIVDK